MNDNKVLNINFLDSLFVNPIISISGCYGYGFNFKDFFKNENLGGMTLKGLTLNERKGNQGNRIAETPCGILNSIGLENPGIDYFIENVWPTIVKENQTNVIININGNDFDEYIQVAKKIASLKELKFVELNLSCPNVKKGGMLIGTEPQQVFEITQKIKSILHDKKLIVKLTPNVTKIQDVAIAAQNGGADAISVINTVLGMEINLATRKPLLGNTFGGLSGPAVFPIALRVIYEIYQVVSIPVIGMGGVDSAQALLKMMMAGASIVGIGTAMLVNPDVVEKIIKELKVYCLENKIQNISEIIGIAHEK